MATTQAFQTEVKQLLQLMIHSLYSNPEIFLRELISNASDALDKLRYERVSNASLPQDELRIWLDFNKAAKTLTISDSGIGLSLDDAINHLGTIAKSGTKEFFSQLTGEAQKDAALIGQFGVGFYSAFIVAEKVSVRSLKAGLASDQAVLWQSAGDGEFSTEAIEKTTHGTEITLHLKDEHLEFADKWRLESLVKKYSDHISFPIQMPKEKWDAEKNEQVREDGFETVNQAQSLWTRPKTELTEEDYFSFYKTLSFDYADPLAYSHNRVEGNSEYTQLLYIPATAPYDLWDREKLTGLKLYVKRVFIMDDAKQLLPTYLRFVKGIIDSQNLPLNVSREILQDSRDVKTIRAGNTKRVLDMLAELAKDKAEQYAAFWLAFGNVLKEGLAEDFANKDKIAKLLRMQTTATLTEGQSLTHLSDYVARMKPEQTEIYVHAAANLATAQNSPHLEAFKAKGIEVLLLTERIDEWMLSYLTEFDGKPVKAIAKGDIDLSKFDSAEEKTAQDAAQETHKALLEAAQKHLGGAVSSVKIPNRLVDSAACITVAAGEMSPQLIRLMQQAGQEVPDTKPVLELNPQHALVQKLANEPTNADIAWVLLDHATLADGGALSDPAAYLQRISKLLA